MKKFFIFSMLCLLMCFGATPALHAQDNCTITSLPFTEGFEGVSAGLPTCFTRNLLGIYQVNNTAQPYVSAWQPHSGSNALRCFNNSYTASSDTVPTFIFPELDSQFDMANIVLEFWARPDYNAAPYLVVGVMDDPTDQSTFTDVETLNFTSPDTYVKFTVYFSSYSGTGRHIAIKIANTPITYGQTFIDDIVLDEVTPCLPVLNLAVNNFFESNVTINWKPNPMADAGNYNVTLFDVDNDSEISSATTADTFFTFTNLSPLTHYRAFVEAVCGAGMYSPADSVDFTTTTPSASFPYFENFEGDSALALSVFTFSGDGVNQWAYGSATGKPDSENPSATVHSLYVSADSGATYQYDIHQGSNSYAVFNVSFPDNDWEYHLSFDYKVKGRHSGYMAFDYLSVVMIDASAELVTDWDGSPIGTNLLTEAANVLEWEHHDVILNNVAGSSKKIIFFWSNFGTSDNLDLNPPAAIDNISVSGSACPTPNGLNASNIDMESATLSWNPGNASAWTVYYKQSNLDTTYTQVSVSGDTFLVITGLTANTDYDFYVVADCGTEESLNSEIFTFRTACGAISQLPYIEDFESGIYTTTQGDYISCWSRYSSDPDHYPYISNSSWYAHNGYYMLDFHYTPNCYDIAIMPELDANINVSDLMITFYACHTYSGYYGSLGTLEVGVMNDPTVESTFVPVDTIDIANLEQYTYGEQMLSFVNYTGTGKFIAFRVSNSESCGYYIDDIILEERPDCMYPNAFVCESVGTDSATLSWNELGQATTWNIQYGVAGFTLNGDSATSLVVNSNPYTVTGLTNLTAYEFYLQSNCGESQSEWIGPLSVVTGVVNIGTIGSDSLTTCNAIICDDGGFDGGYSSYCDYMLVVYPATAGSGLQITGTCELSEGAYGYGESHLYFHDGVGTGTPVIADITGIDGNIAVAASGPITIHFTSAYYNDGAGFMLEVACASCTPPSNLTASDIQNNSITLSWSGNSDQYAVYMTGDATGYYTTSSSSIVIPGLTSNSNYIFQVRSLCGTDSSLLSPAINVSTTCDAYTITMANPWTEDFESYLGGGNQPFECWARPVVDATYGSPFVYCGYSPACHSGSNSAEFKGSSAILVLPVFSNDVHELRLSFWATSTNPSSGTLEVGVMSNFNDPSTFELVATCGEPGPRGAENTPNGNYMGPYDFANVAATNGRIALRYSNSSSWESWNLDDFVVEIAPDCAPPTGLTVSNITETTATATWTAGGNETAWKLQYRQAGTNDWGSEISLTTTSYDFTGLLPETVYQVRVKSDCDESGESGWTNAFDFFTLAPAVEQPVVVTYAATNITQTAGRLNGAITDEGNQTIILKGFEWKLASDNDFTPVVTLTGNTLTYDLVGLTPNTCVNYRAYATTAIGTVYGETLTFCTLPDTPEPCETPTGLHQEVSSSGEPTSLVSWNNNENVSQWNVQYRLENADWTTETSTTNSFNIPNIVYNTNYNVRVQAVCDEDNISEWTAPITMMVPCGINEYYQNVTLYPNPAKEYIDVRVDELNVTSLEVYDVYGKLINTVNVIDNPTRINVSYLANGMYFVRVTTKEGVVTKSFVKK